jgi:hypothetical protein
LQFDYDPIWSFPMSQRLTVIVVAVVSFALGGLLSYSTTDARAATPEGHGKCVGITVVNQLHVCRAFEDGTVEMMRATDSTGSFTGEWKPIGR